MSMSSGEQEFMFAANKMEKEMIANEKVDITFGFSHLNKTEGHKTSYDAYLVI